MKKQGCLYWCTIGWIVWLFKGMFYLLPKWLIQKTEQILVSKGHAIDEKTHKKVSIIVIACYSVILLILMFSSPESDSTTNNSQSLSRSVIHEETTSEPELTEHVITSAPTATLIVITPTKTPLPTATVTPTPTAVIVTDSPTPYVKKYYITDTGSKYHESGCSYLKDSSHEITLEDALAQGYEPCGRCNP